MKLSRPLQLMFVAVVILAAVIILFIKDQPQPAAPVGGSSSALPEAQLDRAVRAGKPALVFYHSNSCDQCLETMAAVDAVYPEFSQAVALVDVNVYDPENEALVRTARVQVIPTLVFYDAAGQTETHVGVMDAEALRERLSGLDGAQ